MRHHQTTLAGFVLHSRAYRETSLLIDLLTEQRGKVRCVVRGAKSAKNNKFALLQPFIPLHCQVSGRGDLLSLTQVDVAAPSLHLKGQALFCGMYLNELVLRICISDEADPELFRAYATTIAHLGQVSTDEQALILREFELYLLSHIGVLPDLSLDADSTHFRYYPQQGFVPCLAHDSGAFARAVCERVQKQQWDSESQRLAKYICRTTIAPLLGDKPLKSRELFLR
jgi:DNA repair protein RecO (recombination protein O)